MNVALKSREVTGKRRTRLPIRALIGMMNMPESARSGNSSRTWTPEYKRGVIELNVLRGKVTIFDRLKPGDPADAYFAMLVVLDTGHLARIPLTQSDFRALVSAGRDEGAVVEPMR